MNHCASVYFTPRSRLIYRALIREMMAGDGSFGFNRPSSIVKEESLEIEPKELSFSNWIFFFLSLFLFFFFFDFWKYMKRLMILLKEICNPWNVIKYYIFWSWKKLNICILYSLDNRVIRRFGVKIIIYSRSQKSLHDILFHNIKSTLFKNLDFNKKNIMNCSRILHLSNTTSVSSP